MKRIGIAILSVALGLVFTTSVFCAEMAKEGSGDYLSAKTSVGEIMAMGKERIQMNYEQNGVVVKVPENSPFHNASFRVLGTLHAIKGKWKGPGFVEWTRPNGDKIYATFEAEGTFGSASKSILTFVGGTGTCAGIQGTLEIEGTEGIKPTKKGVSPGISVGKFNWKIP